MEIDRLELLDWKRRVFALYQDVRASPDPLAAWQEWRAVRDELFVAHPQSPVPQSNRPRFAGLSYYQYDPTARVLAVVAPLPFEVANLPSSTSSEFSFTRFALARFLLFGLALQLELYWLEGYGGGLLLPFSDATNGEETYAGGRYLLDTVKGADLGGGADRLILDFNFAYHPSCVYDPRWSCPLTPPANRLAVPVRAGERLPAGT
ncbi:MAG TPA: DUF1684 domain-containing protein [bacterium]|nr:DUF1684 domain-containing protein [bacterium]